MFLIYALGLRLRAKSVSQKRAASPKGSPRKPSEAGCVGG